MPYGVPAAWGAFRLGRLPHGTLAVWDACRLGRLPHGAHFVWGTLRPMPYTLREEVVHATLDKGLIGCIRNVLIQANTATLRVTHLA